MKYLNLLLPLIVFSATVYGQSKAYEQSIAVDLPQTGVNKVLCMRNGNTMLFHFEPAKRVTVKVFSPDRKEIASQQEKNSVLDIMMDERAVFKGLFDINNEAVLFIDQDHNSRHELVRIRYNATTGKIIEEKLVAQSQSENKRIMFYVMKSRMDDGYQIFFCMDQRHPVKECDLWVVYFNGRHEAVKEVQLPVNRKKYDYLEPLGAESDGNGLLVTVGLDKTTMYGRPNHNNGPLLAGGAIYEHYLSFFYIPANSSTPENSIIDITANVFPFYSLYSYNPFAQSVNALLFSYKPLYYRFGLNLVSGRVSSNLFFRLRQDGKPEGVLRIQNTIASDYLKKQTDTSAFFDGIPATMFTNENGLSTLVSQSDVEYGEPETNVRYDYQDFIGNIGITQFDDDGNEIWGTVLPLAQYSRSHRHYYDVKQFAKRWQTQAFFEDNPPDVYNRQFLSFNAYSRNKSFYIVYNDDNENFNNSLKKPGDTIYNFDLTNACYYKVDSKKQVSKHYLFGEPARNEFKSSFIEGADFDEQRGVYATLIQQKRGDHISLHMAWAHLD